MPYSSVSELPKGVQDLPGHAKKIFMSAFNAAYKQYNSEEKAFKVAWAAVKNKYKKEGDKWVTKSFEFDEVFADEFEFKSENENFYVEGILSTTGLDNVKDYITPECLNDMFDQIEIGSPVKVMTGGLEHEHVLEDTRIMPTSKIVEKNLKDGKLRIKAMINKSHPKFENIWGSIKDGFYNGFSIEFRPVEAVKTAEGHRVLNRVKLGGYALTGRPACPGATITDFYIKSQAIANAEDEMVEEVKVETKTEQKPELPKEVLKEEVKAASEEKPKEVPKELTVAEMKAIIDEKNKTIAELEAKNNDALVEKIKTTVIEEVKKVMPEQKVMTVAGEKFEQKEEVKNFSLMNEISSRAEKK